MIHFDLKMAEVGSKIYRIYRIEFIENRLIWYLMDIIRIVCIEPR